VGQRQNNKGNPGTHKMLRKLLEEVELHNCCFCYVHNFTCIFYYF